VEGTLQVTVISPLATDSDALSNALFVSGPTDRELLLEERQQDSALVIREHFGQEQRGQEKQFATEYQAIRWPADVANGQLAEVVNAKES
jgi:thiamine biosynthesis lipoprotein ApbE